jgi:hypothetical protein
MNGTKMLCIVVVGLLCMAHGMLIYAASPATFQQHRVNKSANKDGPDHVQHKTAGPGWFSNLGPTGIRAMLTDVNGKVEWEGKGTQYLVKYVFPRSPASGLIKPGDIILGVNRKKFQKTYTFGYWFGFGYEGPLTEIGEAVEASEKNHDGKLKLLILRDGKTQTIEVKMKSRGAFAKTFPYDCEKSEAMRKDAIKALLRLQKSDGRWPGAIHADFMACMALMAQGKKSYLKAVQLCLDNEARQQINDQTWHWYLSFRAIAMAEFQMLTGSKRYQAYMMRINDQLKRNNNRFANFTYGHAGPAEGSGGYGPMSSITSLVLLAWVMMEKAGVPIHVEEMERTLTSIDMQLTRKETIGTTKGYGYGWPNRGAVVASLNPVAVAKSLGHLHKNVNVLNTQARTADYATGNMAMVHDLRPWQKYSPLIVKHHVNKIARCRNVMVSGHGSGMLHGWSTFMALCMAHNRGVKAPLQWTMTYNKGLLNSARCHDGSFYTQPQRDDLGGDFHNASRTTATALWLIILSAPDQNLVLLGKEKGSKKTRSKSGSSSKPKSKQLLSERELLLMKLRGK